MTQPALEDTLAASRNRGHGTPLQLLFWVALVPLAVLTAIRQSLRLSCITLIVVVLIPSTSEAYVRPLDRVFGTLRGTLAAIVAGGSIRSGSKKAT